MNIPAKRLEGPEDIRALFPPKLVSRPGEIFSDASLDQSRGYCNTTGGWCEASRACQLVFEDIVRMGAVIQGGKEMVGLVFEHSDEQGPCMASEETQPVKGVSFSDGTQLFADLVVIATGAWTPGLFAQNNMGGLSTATATGQVMLWSTLRTDVLEMYSSLWSHFQQTVRRYDSIGCRRVSIVQGCSRCESSSPCHLASI